MNPEAQSEANDSLQSRLTIVDYVDAVTTDWSSTRLRSISDGVIAGLMANLLTAGVVAFVVANSDGLMTAAQITLAVLVALTGLMVVFAALAILLVLQSQFHEGLRLVAERRGRRSPGNYVEGGSWVDPRRNYPDVIRVRPCRV